MSQAVSKIVDVQVDNHEVGFTFKPLTPAGRDWIRANVPSGPWQWWQGALCVGYDASHGVIQQMAQAGIVLSE